MADTPSFALAQDRAPGPGIRVLAFSDSVLTASAVASLEGALRDARDTTDTVLDCSALRQVTAPGLAALLELGRHAEGLQALALAGLDRTLMLAAVQAGLAERFTIYTTTAAFLHDRSADAGDPSCAP
jgi:ABC-type transporter Mla MlaB component